jgi:dihydroorotate dehydrogenase
VSLRSERGASRQSRLEDVGPLTSTQDAASRLGMSLYALLRPAIFAIDPERAHRLSLFALRFSPFRTAGSDPVLKTQIAGLDFPNPVGLAAGYDKDGEAASALHALGFGAVEIGTLTPRPQPGNPKPRLFRLVEDRAVINRMGFNNGGLAAAVQRSAGARRRGILGINIGANKESDDKILDYINGFAFAAPHADYVTINISSPNTPGLRALQDKTALDELLDGVLGLRSAPGYHVPVFLKIAPDLEPADIDDVAEAAMRRGVDALIVSNTTLSRPPLASRWAAETGGLSGKPLKNLAQQRLIDFRKATGGNMPLIGVGGIESAEDAYARLRAGASFVQIYSALVYHGPSLVRSINQGLKRLLARDGLATLADCIGIDAT